MKLSSFQLKLIALIAMTVDHAGALFFPGTLWMRLLGRLAMPVFCFSAAEGFRHTRDAKKYLLRMLLFALLSALPYFLAFGWTQNVLFSLTCGIAALYYMEHAETRGKKALVLFLFCVISVLLLCDWYFVGVLFVVGFYYADRDIRKLGGVLLAGYLSNLAVMGGAMLFTGNDSYLTGALVQFAGLLALPLLALYSGERGMRLKWGFYIYYPAHLLVLWAIKLRLGGS